MTGKTIEPQIPMSETNYLPPADKPNQQSQLDFIVTVRFKQRRFFILFSISTDIADGQRHVYAREASIGKTAKTFLEHYIC